MYSTSLLILFLSATMGQISVQLTATVGGSVLIPCSLPVPPLRLRWFYWQEDQSDKILLHWDPSGQTMPIADEYKNRCQVFATEFSSGNISIRLDNVTVGDDNKTFWAYVNLMDEKKVTKLSERRCTFTLQVSAPYQHLVLTVNNTANRATCTAHGGYPEPKVSWTGLKKSSTAQLDLQDAETSLQQDPTEKTFSVTSSVSMKEFQSVTCIIFNPRTNQRIKGTAEINASGEGLQRKHWAVGITLLVMFMLFCVWFYGGVPAVCVEETPPLDVPCDVPADGNEEDLQADHPDGGLQVEASASGGDSAEEDASDAHSNTSGGSRSEERVSLRPNQAVFHRSTGRKHGAADSSSDKNNTGANAEQGAAKLLKSKK